VFNERKFTERAFSSDLPRGFCHPRRALPHKTRQDDKPLPGSISFVKPTKLKYIVTADPKTPMQLSSQSQTRGKQPAKDCPKN